MKTTQFTRKGHDGKVWPDTFDGLVWAQEFVDMLELPLHWKKPRRIFVNSMSDLFHSQIPDDYISAVCSVMLDAPWHTYQVLTKRAARMSILLRERLLPAARARHIWWGVSVEDQRAAGERVPLLLESGAANAFLSCEPLLGDLSLSPWLNVCPVYRGTFHTESGTYTSHGWGWERNNMKGGEWRGTGIRLVIAGGESGPKARPCDVAWLRSLRDQCAAADVPFFCKQVGAYPVDNSRPSAHTIGPDRIHMTRHAAGADPAEWPEDLRVQQFPEALP